MQPIAGHSSRRYMVLCATVLLPLVGGSVAAAATPTDLGIRVTATSFKVGVDGLYVITVTNHGPAATDADAVVTDQLPDGLSFVSGVGAGWDCSGSAGRSVTCVNATPIAAGSSTTFRLTVGVCTAAFPSIGNTFSVSYPADSNGANNATFKATSVKSGVCIAATPTPTFPGGTPPPTRTPSLTPIPSVTRTPVAAATDLLLSMTVSRFFTTGFDGNYFVTVTNAGTNATNAPMTVTDTLPSSLSFAAAVGNGWTCTQSHQVVSCLNPSPLAPAGTSTITLTVHVSDAAFPTVTNVATLIYTGDTFAGNNTARRPTTVRRGAGAPGGTPTFTGAPAVATSTPTATVTPAAIATPTVGIAAATDLTLNKTTVGAFRAGLHGLYFLTVTNVGTATTNAPITVRDFLPASLSFATASGDTWSCSAASQIVTCVSNAPLAPTGSTGITLEVVISNAAYPTVTNSASVSYPGDTNALNDSASKPTTVRAGRAVPGAQIRRPLHRLPAP